MSDTPLICEVADGWATLWFNRPEARNALSSDLTDLLLQHLSSLGDRADIRGLTLRGKGGIFCAGGDIKGFKAIYQGGQQNQADVAASSEAGGELFAAINEFPHPVIMLVEGAAMAGGLGIVCAGDVVIVTRDAKFALTETTLGIPPAQITPFVVQRLGLSRARRLMLTAARFDGTEAGEIGLADFVVADCAEAEAREATIRADVLRCAPSANRITKEIVLKTRDLSGEAMRKFAAKGFAQAMLSAEGVEGVSAFIEKRKPNWAVEAGEKHGKDK